MSAPLSTDGTRLWGRRTNKQSSAKRASARGRLAASCQEDMGGGLKAVPLGPPSQSICTSKLRLLVCSLRLERAEETGYISNVSLIFPVKAAHF